MAILHNFGGQKRPAQQNLPYTGVEPRFPSVEDCPNANGYLNNPDDDNNLKPITPYVPPDLCKPEFTISQGDCGTPENNLQEEYADQNLQISGAPVNIFKYLGIFEQGKLIDLVGNGFPLGNDDVSNVFDFNAPAWESTLQGLSVVRTPAYIGYDFGQEKTSLGAIKAPSGGNPVMKMITSLKITQPSEGNRALQLRIDYSNGDMFVNPSKIIAGSSNIGDGVIEDVVVAFDGTVGNVMMFADTPTTFSVSFVDSTGKTKFLGAAEVGKRFLSTVIHFTLKPGTNEFSPNDSFALPVEVKWTRADIVNVPNSGGPVTIQLKQSRPARMWRIVPTVFQGVTNPNASWVVGSLELFDVAAPSLDDIQDALFMENRDRDYAKSAIQIKAAYTPFDSVTDLSKFGFQIADIYTFSTTFASMVKLLGRPIVIGDVLELPSELQYDHNLKPVRKFLEVTDTGWSADGFTTGWKPIIFKFQAQQLIIGQEHQSLFGNIDTQTYGLTDEQQFKGMNNLIQGTLSISERNEAEARATVALTGTEHLEFASAANWMGEPGSYDGREYSMEDGIPPDNQPYTTGYKMPDVLTANDRDFFRLEYEPHLNLPARLYQFSSVKQKWVYIETDRRQIPVSHNKGQRRVFDSIKTMSQTDTKI